MIKTLLVLVALVAAGWGVTLWKAARNEAQSEQTHPPLGRFTRVGDTRVHYVQEGSGPDLVLIHGASGNLRDFTFSMLGQLTDRYRVTVFDRPGLGYTDRINTSGATVVQQAELLSQAAAQIGVTKPVVLGQSYGGAVALAWAVNHPDDLSALVLVAAASKPWTTDLSTFYKITSSWLGGKIAVPFLTAWVPNSKIETTLDEIFAPQSSPEGYGDYIGAGLTLRRVSLRANAKQRANLLHEIKDLHGQYDGIDVPVELLHGDADDTVYLTVHSIPTSEQIPNANLTILDGIGHMPQHVSEAEVLAAIDRAAARAGLR